MTPMIPMASLLRFYTFIGYLTSFVSYNKVQFSLEIFAVALGFLLQKAFDDGRQHKPGSSSCAYNTQWRHSTLRWKSCCRCCCFALLFWLWYCRWCISRFKQCFHHRFKDIMDTSDEEEVRDKAYRISVVDYRNSTFFATGEVQNRGKTGKILYKSLWKKLGKKRKLSNGFSSSRGRGLWPCNLLNN